MSKLLHFIKLIRGWVNRDARTEWQTLRSTNSYTTHRTICTVHVQHSPNDWCKVTDHWLLLSEIKHRSSVQLLLQQSGYEIIWCMFCDRYRSCQLANMSKCHWARHWASTLCVWMCKREATASSTLDKSRVKVLVINKTSVTSTSLYFIITTVRFNSPLCSPKGCV